MWISTTNGERRLHNRLPDVRRTTDACRVREALALAHGNDREDHSRAVAWRRAPLRWARRSWDCIRWSLRPGSGFVLRCHLHRSVRYPVRGFRRPRIARGLGCTARPCAGRRVVSAADDYRGSDRCRAPTPSAGYIEVPNRCLRFCPVTLSLSKGAAPLTLRQAQGEARWHGTMPSTGSGGRHASTGSA